MNRRWLVQTLHADGEWHTAKEHQTFYAAWAHYAGLCVVARIVRVRGRHQTVIHPTHAGRLS